MGEIVRMSGIGQEIEKTSADLSVFMGQMATLLQGMAEMVRATHDRMTSLEQQVRMMEKVTPGQASDLNAAIRARAAAVCAEYRMPGLEKPVAAAIRKAVRLSTGAQSTREISRCDYKPIRAFVETWDEYETIQGISQRARQLGGETK